VGTSDDSCILAQYTTYRDSVISHRGHGSDTHPVDQVEDQAHGHAKLLKVQLPVIIYIGKIPHALELVVPEVRVLEHGRCLGAVEVGGAIGERAEDFPVLFDFVLFDSTRCHYEGLQGKIQAAEV
jgi:hypothetical protein